MEILQFLKAQFAISAQGVSQSWLFWAVVFAIYAVKAKLSSTPKSK